MCLDFMYLTSLYFEATFNIQCQGKKTANIDNNNNRTLHNVFMFVSSSLVSEPHQAVLRDTSGSVFRNNFCGLRYYKGS